MSRQISIDNYFKTKSVVISPGIKTMNINPSAAKKRSSLSLIKTSTPAKTPKSANHVSNRPIKGETEIICLSSDDENVPSPDEKPNLSQNCIKSDTSTDSQATILYSLTPRTPQKTPRKTPQKTLTSSTDSFQSPDSKKFFSPTKRRSVVKRSPVKRNLAQQSFNTPAKVCLDNDMFSEACNEMDDKSIFLLTIINKYLKDCTVTHLLNDTCQELLCRCFQLVKPGVRLVCRLYWRQPGWYRREQLVQISGDKKTIDDSRFSEMMTSLILNGFITPSSVSGINSLSFEEYAKILKSDEMKQICKDLKLKIQSKQDAIEALRAFSGRSSISMYFIGGGTTTNSKRVIDIMKAKAGTCYKLSDIARNSLYKLYVLMYLGMNYTTIRDRKLELVLINDKAKRETYPVDKDMELDSAAVVFRTKEEFAKYLHAHIIYENYLAETESIEKCKTVLKVFKLYKEISEEDMMRYKALPTWLRRFTPAYLYVKILEAGVQELKKDKSGAHYQLALDILTQLLQQIAFRQHKKADWFAEKALILHKLLFRHDEAAKLLLEGLKSNLPEEEKDVMRPRAHNIAKQQNIKLDPALREQLTEYATKELILENKFPADHVTKQPMENYKQRGKKKFEIHTEDEKKFLDCEEYCIVHYTTNGSYTHGEHWEGRIVTTIFALLFWDMIYAKPAGVTGVFMSQYQLYPLDMYTESFYGNRTTVIEDRLQRIETMAVDTLVETMRAKWDERPECELSPINRNIGWDNIRMVAGCLGAKATSAICRRLATNYARAHAGFPDLTLWNAATKKIKFVEVKTDTDKPSMKQLQWMQYLADNGIDTGFCYVGVDTTRVRARAEARTEARTSLRDLIKFESSDPL